MKLRSVTSEDIKNKTVLYRSPYDIKVVLNNQTNEYELADNSRITATLDTLNFLIKNNSKIVILTWVDRPVERDESLTTEPHAKELSRLLNKEVLYLNDCVGKKVAKSISEMEPQDIIMLENTRFYKEEYENDPQFAKKLTDKCDVIVYDAFPQSHRNHASTLGILDYLPSFTGKYFDKEYEALNNLLIPKNPFTLLIGGIKITDKLKAVVNMSQKADNILIGGGVANLFLKASGINIQDSIVEDDLIGNDNNSATLLTQAKAILQAYKDKVHLPIDVKVANSLIKSEIIDIKTIDFTQNQTIPDGYQILDIGEKTIKLFKRIIQQSNTVFWNGPVGLYQIKEFSNGTKSIGEAMTENQNTTVASGGDTIDALNDFDLVEDIKHISLAGGATLKFLSGERLEVIERLKQ